jgi:hypothetical protein
MARTKKETKPELVDCVVCRRFKDSKGQLYSVGEKAKLSQAEFDHFKSLKVVK